MTWELLNKNIRQFNERQEALEAIAQIVASHPDWQKAEPKLKDYLAKVFPKT